MQPRKARTIEFDSTEAASSTLTTLPLDNCRTEPSQPGQGDSAMVHRLVIAINAIAKTATFAFTVRVGKLVIANVYDGDIVAWRHRGPKDQSFRALAMHPNLPMSPSALYRSVAMYELCVRLGIDNKTYLSTSHLRLVLGLESDVQAKLLGLAERERWPVRRLEDEVAIAKTTMGATGRGGRRRRSKLRIASAALSSATEANEAVGEDDVEKASPESRRVLAELLEKAHHSFTSLEQRLLAGSK
jgi:hypothetical protein